MRGCGTRRVVFSWSSTKVIASIDLLLALQRLRRPRQHLTRSSVTRRCGTPPSSSCSAPHRKKSWYRGGPRYQVITMRYWSGDASGCSPWQRTSSPCAACKGRTRPASEGKQQKRTRRTSQRNQVSDLQLCFVATLLFRTRKPTLNLRFCNLRVFVDSK